MQEREGSALLMQTGKNKKIAAAVFWILTAAVMVLIFWFSALPDTESAEQSGFIAKILQAILGSVEINEVVLRKLAHFSEFALLCFTFSFSFYFTFEKPKYYLPLIFSSAYAATDEIHQLFVPGRACAVIDWAIDTAGAIFGLAVFAIFLWIIKRAALSKTQKTSYKTKGE